MELAKYLIVNKWVVIRLYENLGEAMTLENTTFLNTITTRYFIQFPRDSVKCVGDVFMTLVILEGSTNNVPIILSFELRLPHLGEMR